MNYLIYVLRNIILEWANQSVWDRQHMYDTSKRNTYNSLVINRKGGRYFGCSICRWQTNTETIPRNRYEDTWHLWNAPRMYILSHEAYVLNSETYFELPNLLFWQQRWRRFKPSGFSHVANRHTDTDVSKYRSAFTFNVKRSKFSCTASSSRLKRYDPLKRRSSDTAV